MIITGKQSLARRIWTETKKLWRIVGPAIFSRIASYTVFIVSQAFAGHLGDLQLAALSIAVNVIVEFDLGLMHEHQWVGDDDFSGLLSRGIGVRLANELRAANGKAAKLATMAKKANMHVEK